jgi:molybdate transport system substrate-binding protein
VTGRVAVLLAAVALVASCGGGDEDAGAERPRLVVSAAASLTEPLTSCARSFAGADVKLSFAGSDELSAQIRQGVEPDLFAAANTKLPDQLAAEGLLAQPVTFATNELVLAVPSDSRVRRVEDLARAGLKLAVGAESVPVGTYTRTVLGRLEARTERAILDNIRSNEPDVKGVVGKVTQGAADAGFVYASDVTAVEGRLRSIALPDRLEPEVAYGAGVVRGARNAGGAQRFLDGLVDGACAEALRDGGFGPPPGT